MRRLRRPLRIRRKFYRKASNRHCATLHSGCCNTTQKRNGAQRNDGFYCKTTTAPSSTQARRCKVSLLELSPTGVALLSGNTAPSPIRKWQMPGCQLPKPAVPGVAGVPATATSNDTGVLASTRRSAIRRTSPRT